MMIIFDTDLGLGTPRCEIDDGAALIQLLGLFPKAVAAITTVHGNGRIEEIMQNSSRMLTYLNRQDIPLGKGAAFGLIEKKSGFINGKPAMALPPSGLHQRILPLRPI